MIKSKIDDNILKYITWRGDLSFSQDAFNEIDGLIISMLTFLELMGNHLENGPIKLKDAVVDYTKGDKINLGFMIPKDCINLAESISKSKRFGNLLVSNFQKNYNDKVIEQFAGMTVHINDDLMVIAYQGTDDSLIGWQENFNMVLSYPVPAQSRALKYLEEEHLKYPNKKIITVGHSKGGNLSVYAGINCLEDTYKMIETIYSYDGPGIPQEFLKDDLSKNTGKVITILPQKSTVGMIFEQIGKTIVVKSNEKGILQHNGFSWIVTGNKFKRSTLLKNSHKFHDDLNNFINSLSKEEIQDCLDAFGNYIKNLKSTTLVEVTSDIGGSILGLKAFNRKQRKIFIKFIHLFFMNKMI